MIYNLLRTVLFQLDPETAHDWTRQFLSMTPSLPLRFFCGKRTRSEPVRVMGLDFPHPVGLAAGLDKDGECIKVWEALGFGFVEIGTVTPRPQPGNPKPRMFRLPKSRPICPPRHSFFVSNHRHQCRQHRFFERLARFFVRNPLRGCEYLASTPGCG